MNSECEFCYLSLGPVPWAEECVQVGRPDYDEQVKIETTTYIGQLSRSVTLPDGARFMVKANPHDFGTYHEVNIEYPSQWELGDLDSRLEKLFDIESDLPENWDNEAKKYLVENSYKI
jgi:hypothetical protein